MLENPYWICLKLLLIQHEKLWWGSSNTCTQFFCYCWTLQKSEPFKALLSSLFLKWVASKGILQMTLTCTGNLSLSVFIFLPFSTFFFASSDLLIHWSYKVLFSYISKNISLSMCFQCSLVILKLYVKFNISAILKINRSFGLWRHNSIENITAMSEIRKLLKYVLIVIPS